MQTSQDPRHLLRKARMQSLFEWDFDQKRAIHNEYVENIIKKISQIDSVIQQNATQWQIPEMAKVDVAILRLAAYELIYDQEIPANAVIDEAVELAKEFGNEKSPKFINGTLDRIKKQYEHQV